MEISMKLEKNVGEVGENDILLCCNNNSNELPKLIIVSGNTQKIKPELCFDTKIINFCKDTDVNEVNFQVLNKNYTYISNETQNLELFDSILRVEILSNNKNHTMDEVEIDKDIKYEHISLGGYNNIYLYDCCLLINSTNRKKTFNIRIKDNKEVNY